MTKRHLVLVALSLSVSCGGKREAQRDDTVATPTMHDSSRVATVAMSAAQIAHGGIQWSVPTLTAVAGSVEVPGQLAVNQDRTSLIAAPAQARVVAVHVSPGQRVDRGAALISLQSADANAARADLDKASAEVSSRRAAAVYARTARERAERLLALKAIAQQDYERAIADDELARAGLTQAEAELSRARSVAQQLGVDLGTGQMTLRAPISGVVASREAIPGSVVSAGAPLVTVTDPSSLWLSASLPEQVAAEARPGNALRFTVATYQADTFVARIQSVSPTFDPATRSLPVRALVANAARRLRPEMFAKVWIEGGVGQTLPAVPIDAVQRIENRTVLFVADPGANGGARFEAREVVLGRATRDSIAIVEGLSSGQPVVMRGAVAVKAELLKKSMPRDMEP